MLVARPADDYPRPLSEVKRQDGRIIGYVGESWDGWMALLWTGVFVSPIEFGLATEFQALSSVYRAAYRYDWVLERFPK